MAKNAAEDFEDWAMPRATSTSGTKEPAGAGLKRHPIAEAFDLPHSDGFDALKEDIRINGQLEPIITCDGQLLDGRDRERACLELGLEPIYKAYAGDHPLVEFGSRNLHRRNLEKAQRAIFVALIADPALQARHGGIRDQAPEVALGTVKRQADEAGCGVTLQGIANRIVQADPATARRVLFDKLSIKRAEAIAFPEKHREKKVKPDIHAECKEHAARLEQHIGTTDVNDPNYELVSPQLANYLRETIRTHHTDIASLNVFITQQQHQLDRHRKAGHVLPPRGDEE